MSQRKFLRVMIFVSLLGICTLSYSQSLNFEGISVSAGAGLSSAKTTWDKRSVSNPTNLNWSASYGATDYIGVIDASYSKAISSSILIGLGVSFDIGSTKAGYDRYLQTGCDYCADLQIENHRSIYIKPEWAISNTTSLYGKIGFDTAKSFINDPNGQMTSLLNVRTNVRGNSYGLGMRTFFGKNMFAGVEVKQVDYKVYQLIQSSDLSYSVKHKNTVGIFNVGYKF